MIRIKNVIICISILFIILSCFSCNNEDIDLIDEYHKQITTTNPDKIIGYTIGTLHYSEEAKMWVVFHHTSGTQDSVDQYLIVEMPDSELVFEEGKEVIVRGFCYRVSPHLLKTTARYSMAETAFYFIKVFDIDDISFENDVQGCLNEGFICSKVENASEPFIQDVVEVSLGRPDVSSILNDENQYDILALSEMKDGRFTLELPTMLAPNYLHPLIRGEWSMDANKWMWVIAAIDTHPDITISNTNVNLSSISHFHGVDKNDHGNVYFSLRKHVANSSIQAVFTFVDSDVTISGHYRPRYNQQDYPYEKYEIYSLQWKKGWNVWYLSQFYTNIGGTQVMIEEWTSIPLSGLKWNGEFWGGTILYGE